MNNTTSERNMTAPLSCYYLDRFQIFHPTFLTVPYIINCTLNAVLSVTAILGNVMILHALRRTSVIRPPSRALLFSLALSDLAIGLVVQPLYVIYKIAELKGNHRVYCIAGTGFHLSANVFSAVSFLTVVAIAVDRLLALCLGLKYHSTVTLRRVLAVIVSLWALTSLWVFTWLRGARLYQVFNISAASICLSISLGTYASLLLRIRRLKTQAMSRWKIEGQEVKGEAKGPSNPKLTVYKRSVMNMFYIYVLLLVCYTPYLAMFVVFETSKISVAKIAAISYSITVLFANATLNPFLYCWRIREIRKEVFAMISKFCSKE